MTPVKDLGVLGVSRNAPYIYYIYYLCRKFKGIRPLRLHVVSVELGFKSPTQLSFILNFEF
jgi:hypothetical protein